MGRKGQVLSLTESFQNRFDCRRVLSGVLALKPPGSSFVLFQGPIQLINQIHQLYGVGFLTGLFRKGANRYVGAGS